MKNQFALNSLYVFWSGAIRGPLLPQDDNNDTTNERVIIFINRSRVSWMPIQFSDLNYSFSVGDIELDQRGLAPQSVVLYLGDYGEKLQKLLSKII